MTPTPHPDAHKPNQGLAQVDDPGLVEGADAGFEQETGPAPDSDAEPGTDSQPDSDSEPAATSAPATRHPQEYDLGQLRDGSDKGPVAGPPDSADAYGSGQDEGSID